MKKKILYLLIALGLVLLPAVALLAQAESTPTPVVTPTPGGILGYLPSHEVQILAIVGMIVAFGYQINKIVDGIKDQAMFADFMAAHPKFAQVLSGTLSFIATAGACFLTMGLHDMAPLIICVLSAVATYFTAAGFHRADKRQGIAPPPTGAGPVAVAKFKSDVKAQNAT